MICPHCMNRETLPGYRTCGNSYCQEAAFHLNRARNARKGSKRERDAFRRYNEITMIAQLFADDSPPADVIIAAKKYADANGDREIADRCVRAWEKHIRIKG